MAKLLGGTTVYGNLIVNSNVSTGGGVYTTTGLFWAGNNNVISTGGGSAAAGASSQMQYNNGGVLGAATMLYYSANTAILANANLASANTTSGSFQVLGGAGITGAVYAGSIQNTPIGSTTASTGAFTSLNAASGLTASSVSAATIGNAAASGQFGTVTATTVNAATLGNASAAHVGATVTITGLVTANALNAATIGNAAATGQFGTITATTLNAATIGNTSATLTGTLQTAAQTNITSVGTLAGLTTSANISAGGWILPTANATYNLGATTAWWNVVYGKAVQAQYADLAENYAADSDYPPGTVVVFGGENEITISTQDHDSAVAGVISTDPAYLMNSVTAGLPVALTGRVPCQVQGPVVKGDVLVTSKTPGVAQKIDNSRFAPGCVIGKSLGTIVTDEIELIEVVVGRF